MKWALLGLFGILVPDEITIHWFALVGFNSEIVCVLSLLEIAVELPNKNNQKKKKIFLQCVHFPLLSLLYITWYDKSCWLSELSK